MNFTELFKFFVLICAAFIFLIYLFFFFSFSSFSRQEKEIFISKPFEELDEIKKREKKKDDFYFKLKDLLHLSIFSNFVVLLVFLAFVIFIFFSKNISFNY